MLLFKFDFLPNEVVEFSCSRQLKVGNYQFLTIMSNLEVFKFGGASVCDIDGIKNVATIITSYSDKNLIIVVSAMGKTTDALEDIVKSYFGNTNAQELLNVVKQKHFETASQLLKNPTDTLKSLNDLFVEIEWILEDEPHDAYDYIYDQIVSLGELLSTRIVADYLHEIGLNAEWFDARDVVKTDETWREARVNWQNTELAISKSLLPKLNTQTSTIVVTQGFIGSTKDNNTTTLGREGSDFSAAIFSHFVHPQHMTIWKDVDGVYSGDPRIFKNVEKLPHISFDEAIEMTYFGATVVHPRTIQPLKQKNVPLVVRSFFKKGVEGTQIGNHEKSISYPPIFTIERHQTFIRVLNKDASFLVEQHIALLFQIFAKHFIFVNLLQNSGSYFYVAITHIDEKHAALLADLEEHYTIECFEGYDLFTIRHFTESAIQSVIAGKKIAFEKSFGDTFQVLLAKG